ncbi:MULTISPECIES: flavin reductase family protein [unclassified Nocardioides]|uniref:flavin reductase family protein n=1 Tax=unclassified Nocardioides TaxID=2615069 RepID=UPI0009EFFA63|nr:MULTISPECIES: flavin reductase family protein [unclassified Nocardioides]GAW47991.1 Flavin reductase domain protein FMN-binding protein [Nocardioides sp. PD653-B2]GAW53706.1 Flavin reductase domain protein FMN-binding protein [Nocardioides sp. PD653]
MHTPVATDDLTQTYRCAIARFCTGVTVITTNTPDGPVGMTASAVTSLSLDPLQLIVCIGNTLATKSAITETGRFAVNVLSRDQEHLARRFASRGVNKFAGLELLADHDVPVLANTVAHFVCETAEAIPGGDHTIMIGDVIACAYDPDISPLLYYGSAFGSLCDEATHARLGFEMQIAAMA